MVRGSRTREATRRKAASHSEHDQRFRQRRRRYQDGKVRVAIIGVGNCASSFVQGVQYYRDADPSEAVPGLMHVDLGGYHVRDIEFSAAFDIDAEKVGKDLSEAIFAGQNNTLKFAGEGPEPRRAGRARDDPRRPRASTSSRRSPRPPVRPPTSSRSSRRRAPTWSSPTCRSAPSRRPSGTSSRSSTRAAGSSTASPCSSPARTTGTSASRRPGCRSSATTSSRRSARRSCTARWPGCSTSAA